MKKLTEKTVLDYFSNNNKIIIYPEKKMIALDNILWKKDSIIKRLCYLINECGWKYIWY